jgi:TRAP-type uncharacterized transport system substrate-binding protein
VARIPRSDHELIAIAPWSPVKSLAEIAQHKAVRISMRTDELYEFESAIFQQYGYSLGDIAQGGGRYWHIATGAHDLDRELADQSVDIVIGHAAYTPPWRAATDAGFRFVPLEAQVVDALERVGFTRRTIQPAEQPGLSEPLLTLDLADQPIVSSSDVDDDVIYEITKSIDLNKRAISDSGRGQTEEIERQWETPLVPLHDGAARYYREAGYIK